MASLPGSKSELFILLNRVSDIDHKSMKGAARLALTTIRLLSLFLIFPAVLKVCDTRLWPNAQTIKAVVWSCHSDKKDGR